MKYINCHTHHSTHSKDVLEIVNQYPHEWDAQITHYSLGIHPMFIDLNRVELDLDVIQNALVLPECVAVGECGLDKRSETPFNVQVQVFQSQLQLAQKYQKPVIIHCVGAIDEVMRLKKGMNISVPMIIHGFSKKMEMALQLVNHGFYLSFGPNLIDNAPLQLVFNKIPNQHLWLETDTSTTIEMVSLYTQAARCKNITVPQLQANICTNFQTVFGGNNLNI